MGRTKTTNLKLIIGALVVFIAAFFAYSYLSVQANKKTFQQARTAVDDVFVQTATSLGSPDSSKRVNSCGDSQCTVYTAFVYGVADKSQAEKDLQAIQSNIKSQSNFVPAKGLSTQITTSALGYHSAQDVYNFKSLSCTAKYLYDTPKGTLLKQKDKSKKPFYVEIGCTGPAKKEFYPRSK